MAEAANPYRLLPAVEEVLRDPEVAALPAPRPLVVALVQDELARWRERVRSGELDADALAAAVAGGAIPRAVGERARAEAGRGLVRVVNATGVVLHTGLGRAPVHPEAAAAMAEAAGSYGLLEVDRATGARGRRDARLGELLARLTGAEAGIAVNNNAAAVLLALQALAAGRAAVVSRGELVEIGGSFRMPDVMERAGVRLVEVGTTNRTRAEDYRRAAGDGVALLVKVHRSNFRLVGFAEEVGAAELAALGGELGLATLFDLGSGLVDPPGAEPLAARLDGEPLVREAVAAGVDVVTFSGDKLFGGPQAGLVVGRRAHVERLRASPLYRALRLDKVALAGLERTVELLLAGRGDELPARAMLRARPEELGARAEALARALRALPGVTASVRPGSAPPGSGSAPGVELPGPVVALEAHGLPAEALASRLRTGEPPVFARIRDARLLLDPRTLLPGDEERVVAAVRALA